MDVTFVLALGLSKSKALTITGIGGPWSGTQTWTRVWSSHPQRVNSPSDWGRGRGRETWMCRHLWACLWKEERRVNRGKESKQKRGERKQLKQERRGKEARRGQGRKRGTGEERGWRLGCYYCDAPVTWLPFGARTSYANLAQAVLAKDLVGLVGTPP